MILVANEIKVISEAEESISASATVTAEAIASAFADGSKYFVNIDY